MREDLIKVNIGIVLAIVGSALTALNAFAPAGIIDYLLIALGVGLIVVYCFLTWDWFEAKFGNNASFALFFIPLLIFGLVTVIFALFSAPNVIPGPHDKVMLGLGAALIVVPIFLLWQSL